MNSPNYFLVYLMILSVLTNCDTLDGDDSESDELLSEITLLYGEDCIPNETIYVYRNLREQEGVLEPTIVYIGEFTNPAGNDISCGSQDGYTLEHLVDVEIWGELSANINLSFFSSDLQYGGMNIPFDDSECVQLIDCSRFNEPEFRNRVDDFEVIKVPSPDISSVSDITIELSESIPDAVFGLAISDVSGILSGSTPFDPQTNSLLDLLIFEEFTKGPATYFGLALWNIQIDLIPDDFSAKVFIGETLLVFEKDNLTEEGNPLYPLIYYWVIEPN